MRETKKITLEDAIENDSIHIKESTELGQVMENLDNDSIDPTTKMSSIDFNTRLKNFEVGNVIIFDELVRLGIFPCETGLTRQKKRLSVSIEGKGRAEKVQIVAGHLDRNSGTGFFDKFKQAFSPTK